MQFFLTHICTQSRCLYCKCLEAWLAIMWLKGKWESKSFCIQSPSCKRLYLCEASSLSALSLSL